MSSDGHSLDQDHILFPHTLDLNQKEQAEVKNEEFPLKPITDEEGSEIDPNIEFKSDTRVKTQEPESSDSAEEEEPAVAEKSNLQLTETEIEKPDIKQSSSPQQSSLCFSDLEFDLNPVTKKKTRTEDDISRSSSNQLLKEDLTGQKTIQPLDPTEIRIDTITDILLRDIVSKTFGYGGVFDKVDRAKNIDPLLAFENTLNNAYPDYVLKGIETDCLAVDEYLLEVFIKIKED